MVTYPNAHIRAEAGDPRRFWNLVCETWSRIAEAGRAEIDAHWRTLLDGFDPQEWPRILLARDWEGRGPRDWGMCNEKGLSLHFFAPIIEEMPDDVAHLLIAHELGHVVEFARWRPGMPGSKADMEAAVWQITEGWGLPASALRRWEDLRRESLDKGDRNFVVRVHW